MIFNMENKINVEFKILTPQLPGGNGRTIKSESFEKAINDYLSNNNSKLLYFDDSSDGVYHKMEDVCGTIEHISKREDDNFTAEAIIIPNTLKGRMVCNLMNDEKCGSEHICVTPDGFYDPETEKFTITSYTVSFEKNDNKGKDNKEA